jgi:hypothetical protein
MEDEGVDGWNILQWILGRYDWGGGDWTGLAANGDKWRALVNAVMNIRFQLKARKFSDGCRTADLSSSAQIHRVSWSVWTAYVV